MERLHLMVDQIIRCCVVEWDDGDFFFGTLLGKIVDVIDKRRLEKTHDVASFGGFVSGVDLVPDEESLLDDIIDIERCSLQSP